MHAAAGFGHKEIAELLIKASKGDKINKTDMVRFSL